MLSFVLAEDTSLRNDAITRLIPLLFQLQPLLQNYQPQPSTRMHFVETLWLFGSVMHCEDQRLRYEFVNGGSYAVVTEILKEYPLLNRFFPRISETVTTSSILKATMMLSRHLLA